MTAWTALSWHNNRDEDNILDQIYDKQIFSAFYYEDLKFGECFKKCIFKDIYSTLQQGTHKIEY